MPLYRIDDLAPQLGERVWIAPSADVIGDVRLADDSSVWFGAVIRGDNTPILVGARSNIQEGAMCHSDPGAPLTIGADCTIGHHAILHGCTIGDRVLIGMGNHPKPGGDRRGLDPRSGRAGNGGQTLPARQSDRRQPGACSARIGRGGTSDVAGFGAALRREWAEVCRRTDVCG